MHRLQVPLRQHWSGHIDICHNEMLPDSALASVSISGRSTIRDVQLTMSLFSQGWRRSMEDAHIATINLGNAPDAAIFGVFDGHGGRLVHRHPFHSIA